MSIHQELINFDQRFNQLKTPPLVINDLIDSSEEDKINIKKQIFTKYESDMLTSLPSCECGQITGGVNIGVTCSECKTVVTAPLEQDIEPIMWMRAPQGVSKLINPIVWTMITERFIRSGFDIIQWICDTTYKPGVKTPAIISVLQEAGIKRGYNYFIDNFFPIIEFLNEQKSFKRKGRNYLMELLYNNKDCIFSTYLPLPNKSILVIEENTSGIYADPIVIGAIDAIQTISAIDSAMSQHSVRVKENRTIKAIAKLASFYDDVYKNNFAQKGGIFRKHVFGSRSNFSFRAVISSLTQSHDYREIHIPWGVGTSVFRIHLLNKLFARNFKYNDAVAHLNACANRYDPLLDELFKEIIKESPGIGVGCLSQRNPSLMRGSAQLTWITKVKTDPDDPTVGISILIVKSLNAD